MTNDRIPKLILPSLRMLLILTVLTGVLYPVLLTLIAQAAFPRRANGSLIGDNGKIIGSSLIAQKFQSGRYFHSRPSAIDDNPLPSGATNLGPTSKTLKDSVDSRRHAFIRENGLPEDTPVPVEMLSASGSGIDPHISPEAAMLQVNRVARARGFDEKQIVLLVRLVQQHTEGLQFGFLGEPRVNVLMLNIALDGLFR